MSPFGYILDGDGVQRERVVATAVIRSYVDGGGEETVVEGLPRDRHRHPTERIRRGRQRRQDHRHP
jgi:hypothetical protein